MENFNRSFPIDFIKKEERIVVGIATADNVDKAGDIIDFNASLLAFKNWSGNIREMHSPIAVGKAIKYEPVVVKGADGESYNAIRVEAYISKGAQDTWEKVLDGTLRAFSIGGRILEKQMDTKKIFRGKPVNVIKNYELGELSLVDNPANQVAVIDIVKMDSDGNFDYVLKVDCGDIDLSIPDSVQKIAAIGLAQHKEFGRGGTSVGLGSARRLSAGGNATEEFVRKVARYFPRHEVDKQGKGWSPGEDGYPSNGRIAWNLWGGDAGWAWARSKTETLNNCTTKFNEDFDIEKQSCSCGCSIPDKLVKEGEVATTDMNSGLKNPQQGYGNPSAVIKPKKKKRIGKKKETVMKKSTDSQLSVIDELTNSLTNATILYFSAHRAHWNVEGPDFFEYHNLFQEIYEDIYGSIDPFAENIRKLGGFPPGLTYMEDSSLYEDDSQSSDAKELAYNLYTKNLDFIDILKQGFNVANTNNEQGIANFYAERIDQHEKWDWQLRSSLMAAGIEIPEMQSTEDDSTEVDSTPMNDIMQALADMLNNSAPIGDIQKFVSEEDTNITKMQADILQNDVQYDTILSMEEQDYNKLSLLKRFINWVVQDVEEATSTEYKVEVSDNTLEEEMDIEVLKDALSAVVDEKLANFATSIKEEVEATVQEKIDSITKSFEVQTTDLQAKLEATEKSLADQEEKVNTIATSGAIKKSVDPEDDADEEELIKSASTSVWNNVYLPQGLISALGYQS